MTIEIIDSVERLRAIEDQWKQIVLADPASTPFQLPRWLLTWWEYFGSGSLHVITLWEEDQLAGIVPCFRHEWEGRQQLTLIGSGISDYLDPVLPPGAIETLQRHLDTNQDWDVCNWQDLSADTPLQKLRGALVKPEMQCSEATLTGDFDHFWQTRSRGSATKSAPLFAARARHGAGGIRRHGRP